MKATSLHNPFPARPDDPDERLAITHNCGPRLSAGRVRKLETEALERLALEREIAALVEKAA